jgi:hypothetical protein
MFDAKPLQIGFVLLQSPHGFIAFHNNIIANPSSTSFGFAKAYTVLRQEGEPAIN